MSYAQTIDSQEFILKMIFVNMEMQIDKKTGAYVYIKFLPGSVNEKYYLSNKVWVSWDKSSRSRYTFRFASAPIQQRLKAKRYASP